MLWLMPMTHAAESHATKLAPVLDGTNWKMTFPAANFKGNAFEIGNPRISKILAGIGTMPDGLGKYFWFSDESTVSTTRFAGVTTLRMVKKLSRP